MRARLSPLLAHLEASRLDRELAAGTSTWQTPEHAARARYLTADGTRRMIARSLEKAVEGVEAQPQRAALKPTVQTCRPAVAMARPQLLAITGTLRSGRPLAARGVAILMRLLTDGSGPLYVTGSDGELSCVLAEAARYLDASD